MKHFYLLISLFLLGRNSSAQTNNGLSVKSPVFWYITGPDSSPQEFKSNLVKDTSNVILINSNGQYGYMNFRNAISFSGSSKMAIDVTGKNLDFATYFIVYKSSETTKEQVIWYTSDDTKTALVATTSRTADLRDYRYMNYLDISPSDAKLNTIIVQREKDSIPIQERLLNIGFAPDMPHLPVQNFKGLVPELIIYDRVLNREEVLKVSSYLCLKYGVTLSDPAATYLNSSNAIIWDGLQYPEYHHNISGIVRDDSSGLLQKLAITSNPSPFVSFETKDSLSNNSFFIWGDNGLPLMLSDKTPGLPSCLQRKGLVVATGVKDTLAVQMSFDTKQFDIPFKPAPIYWLAIDNSGASVFSAASTRYLKMGYLDRDKIVHFNKVVYMGNADKTMFGLVPGGEILASTQIFGPTCANPNSGSLIIKVWGAEYPCSLQIYNDNGGLIKEAVLLKEQPMTVTGMKSGIYHLSIKDALGFSYRDSMYVNPKDALFPISVDNSYSLQEGKKVDIDASVQMPTSMFYEWNGPLGFHSSSPKISISNTGIYKLKATYNGCSFQKEILVKAVPKNIFTEIAIFPNPSTTGDFECRLSLDKIANVQMSIFTEDGRLVTSHEFKGFQNYSFTEHLENNGLYFIVFKSGLSTISRQLVILK